MAITDTSAAQLIINQLTREQYNNLVDTKAIVDNQLYIIDENILSSANEYFKTPVAQKDFQISAYADAAVVNKAYINKVVSNITEVINTKQNKLTDSNEGAYIDITANDNSSLTTIAVTNVVSAGTAISAEATQSSLTTSKAVKEYVAAKTASGSHTHAIADVTGLQDALNAKQNKLTADSHITITTDNKISVSDITNDSDNIDTNDTGLTTGKAVHDYVNSYVTTDQKANWTSTSTTVADNKSTWDKAGTALQEITSDNEAYIIIENNNKVKPIIADVTLETINSNTTGIVPPSVIAALKDKVNEFHQIPQFSVVVAYSINLTAKTYKLAEGGDDNDCVQNTVYLVADENSVTGTHIEYLCYSETRVIEQIGTTEIDLSNYATKTDEYETSSPTDTTTLITAKVKSKVTTAVTNVSVDYTNLNTKLTSMVNATTAAQTTANGAQTAAAAAQDTANQAVADAKTAQDAADANAAAIAQMIVFRKHS